MKKIICLFFIVLISCTKNNMCDDLNNNYILKLDELSKEESIIVLDNWIDELRKDNCSPYVYYKYYDEIINE